MKNIFRFISLLLLGLLPQFACNQYCDIPDFGIQSIQPAANPAGYEIFIAANGVDDATSVRFDAVSASVRTTEGGLIAQVPTGLAGTVSVSITSGNCTDSRSFDVLGAYPGNVPASPTLIVLPQTPASVPNNITNNYTNVFDPDHFIVLGDDGTGNLDFSTEFHNTNAFLTNNPVTGHYDKQNNTVVLVIDRTAKAGGTLDTLNGQFIAPLPQQAAAKTTLLLTSKNTGRQLALFTL